MGRNTMAVIQTCQIQAIITVPQRLSFSAQLSNCNVVTCWQIKLIISHHTQPSPTLAFSERLTDKEIGLNTNGLTKQKNEPLHKTAYPWDEARLDEVSCEKLGTI